MVEIINFDTKTITPSNRLHKWNNYVSEAFSSCTVDGRKDFIAQYKLAVFNNCNLAKVNGDAAKFEIRESLSKSIKERKFAILAHNKGGAIYTVNGNKFTVGNDEFVFIDMNQNFSIDVREDDKEIQKLIINHQKINQLFLEPERLNGARFSRFNGTGILLNNLWETIWKHSGQLSSDSDSVLMNALEIVLNTQYQPTNHDKHLVHIMRFIKDHFNNEDLTTKMISCELGISERTIQTVFATTGTTPTAYIRQLRLEFAAKQLKNSQCNISKIAYDAGFSDISLFNKQFKLAFLHSPSKYRKLIT